MTDLDLDAIEARVAKAVKASEFQLGQATFRNICQTDVPALVAEVRRLNELPETLAFYKECAATPLMSRVLAERDAALTQVARLREAAADLIGSSAPTDIVTYNSARAALSVLPETQEETK